MEHGAKNELRERVLEELDVRIARPPLPVHYRIGIALVAVAMLLLPPVYAGLVAAVAYGLYYHATESAFGPAYVGVLLVGAVVLVFLVKPLFARKPDRARPVEVSPEREPFLYEFVRSLCAATGAPRPKRILVDCNANASAGFHLGSVGALGGKHVLLIGLPLVEGLSLAELAGVLAHEFGHFTQGAGMRLSFAISAVNRWFARVVFERDAWDDGLTAASTRGPGFTRMLARISRLLVWITRTVLFVLMWVGRAISGYLSRQMEYAADRYALELFGANAFEASMRRIPELQVAAQVAGRNLNASWREGKLADDFPRLVGETARQLGEENVARLQAALDAEPTAPFATHPRTVDRIAVARASFAPEGLVSVGAPASILFDHYRRVCTAATITHYRALFPEMRHQHLVPVEELIAEQRHQDEEARSLARFLQCTADPFRRLELPEPPITPPEDPDGVVLRLEELRGTLLQLGPEQRRRQRAHRDALRASREAETARDVLRARTRIDAASFSAETAAGAGLEQAERERVKLDAPLAAFDSLVSERLTGALQLLQVPDSTDRIQGARELRSEASALVAALHLLQEVAPDLLELSRLLETLGVLLGNLDVDDERYGRTVLDRAASAQDILRSVSDRLGEHPYPFGHAAGPTTIRAYALTSVPGPRELGAIFQVGRSTLERLVALHLRVLGRLAAIAEKVERALGFETLPEWEDEPTDPST